MIPHPAKRPWLVNVMAQSVDGRIALGSESSAARRNAFLHHPDDLHILRETVAGCDAVIVGARTILSERGALRVADARPQGVEPTWVVCSASGSLDFSHPFWRQEGIGRMLCTLLDADDPSAGAGPLVVQTALPSGSLAHAVGTIPEVLRWMREKMGWKRVALLGGGALNGLFWRARVVDELLLTIAPTLIPSDAAPSIVQGLPASPIPLELLDFRTDRGFLFLRYAPAHPREVLLPGSGKA